MGSLTFTDWIGLILIALVLSCPIVIGELAQKSINRSKTKAQHRKRLHITGVASAIIFVAIVASVVLLDATLFWAITLPATYAGGVLVLFVTSRFTGPGDA